MVALELILMFISTCFVRGQPLGEGRKTVRFNSGDEAVLACPLAWGQQTSCHWLKDGWMLELGGRYSSSSSSSSSQSCELVIRPVLPLDQGEYHCQLGGSSPLKSPPVVLSVNTEPSQPEILQGEKMMVETGQTLQLSCQAGGAKPPADIEWWDVQTGQRIEAEVSQHVERKQNSFTSTSTIKLSVSSGMSVRCSASSETFPVKKFSPPLHLSLTGQLVSFQVAEGDSVTLDCDTGRAGERYDWYLNNGPLPGEKQQELRLTNFAPSFDGAVAACEVEGKLIKRFQLNLLESDADGTTTRNNRTVPTVKPQSEQKARGKIKTLYTCTFTEQGDGQRVPSSVLLTGKPKKIQVAEDEFNRKFRCKRFSKNKVKFDQIQNILKSYGTKIKKIHKELKQML